MQRVGEREKREAGERKRKRSSGGRQTVWEVA
jgi:hypothetical protein